MFKIRTTKTGSGNTAVQVVYRQHQNTRVIKHIGTSHDKDELNHLLKLADQYILSCSPMQPLFPEALGTDHIVSVENLSFTKTLHTFAHEFLNFFYALNGFDTLRNNLLRDLSFMRIIEPSSKLRAAELFNAYFGKTYTRNTLYKTLPKIRLLKDEAEERAVSYAKKHLSFNFSLVFYDVTTLYFETFKEDTDTRDEKGTVTKGFRKPGFSKDNKANQPQIVIGLIVTREGFPVACDVFEGNTFEGKTFIPTITRFRDTYSVNNLIVVADAAMISFENIEKLKENNLSYIVGARLANLKRSQIEEISKNLGVVDKSTTRITTEGGLLLCDFSFSRYKKDTWEMEKQIAKAENLLKETEGIKRTKFLINKDRRKTEQILNIELIEKTKLLLGVKGYYTNLTQEPNETIIAHYHNLWHVEKAFRIAKSDLQARPIFHHKKESIETHILIVFVSLCLAKSIELKTGYSIRRVRDMIWGVLDIEFIDTLTGKKFVRRMDTTGNPMAEILEKMKHVLKG